MLSLRIRAWRVTPLFVVAGASAYLCAAGCVPTYMFPDAGTGDAALDGESGTMSEAASPPDALTGSDGADAPYALGPAAILDSYTSGFCAVRGGRLLCWGDVGANEYGTLGFADVDAATAFPFPSPVVTVGTPSQIGIGSKHACSLYGRAVYCRGDNAVYELGNATAPGGPAEVTVDNAGSGFDALGVGSFSTCGIVLGQDAGAVSNVYCWGVNGEGELGRPLNDMHPPGAWPVTGEIDGGPTGVIGDAVAIAAGGLHTCVITARHTILCWGSTQYYESGPSHGLAPCPGSTVPSCDDQPQQIVLPNGDLPSAIGAGEGHTCALGTSGSVYCWGYDGDNELGDGIATAQTCTDSSNPPVQVPCSATPLKVPGLPSIAKLRVGGLDTCALDAQGHAYCWGMNDDGENGAGDDRPHQEPVEILDFDTSQAIPFDDMALGFERVCGESGTTLYCWGATPLGTQSADGSVPDNYYAQPVHF